MLYPETLYKFAYYEYLLNDLRNIPSDARVKYITRNIEDIAQIYLIEFKPIIVDQINKYVLRGRIERGIKRVNTN